MGRRRHAVQEARSSSGAGQTAPRGKNGPVTERDGFLEVFRSMLAAREVDRLEAELVSRGEAFFHVSGGGHEGTAVLAAFLTEVDWLHCHYRDKALLIARGVTPEAYFHSLLCDAQSHSGGRQMSSMMSDPGLNVLSVSVPVGNNALQTVGVASAVKDRPGSPIVLCSLGDGGTQEGEVLEAVAEAVRSRLPVMFLIHDNHFSISTRTAGKTFYDHPGGPAREFYGVEIHRLNGRDPFGCAGDLGAVVARMREDRGPSIVLFDVERLSSHTNADDEGVYRSQEEIRTAWETGDPVRISRERFAAEGVSAEKLEALAGEVTEEVEAACERARDAGVPTACHVAKRELPPELRRGSPEYTGDTSEPRLTMLMAIREVLRAHLARDERVTLYGQDIEDPKGDVFGVTRGLTNEFPGRVVNAPLTESTIVGASVGRALTGARPVAFVQFADFLPLAYNQITSELGSMYWRTDGGWQAPVIVMVACGGYKPGVGPFHSQTFESMAAHVPGVDVFMPSTAGDAAGLLNASFRSERPTIFFFPKNLLNDRAHTTSADVDAQLVPIGRASVVRVGGDVTLVGWGSATGLCERAAEELEYAGIESEVIDLRSLSPWDEECVVASAHKTGHLVVVHEDNRTCGMGAEIIATVAERAGRHVAALRVTRPDTYVPCQFENQLEILPSFKRVLTAAADLLGLDVSWKAPEVDEPGVFTVKAMGSSPSDESVTVVELLVEKGATIAVGDLIANVEADKASAEISSPVAGVVDEIRVEEGRTVKVGAPLLSVRLAPEMLEIRKPVTQDEPGTPMIRRVKSREVERHPAVPVGERKGLKVGLASLATALGSRVVPSRELADRFEGLDMGDLVQRTGIESRHWLGEGETPLSLAVKAAEDALTAEGIGLFDLDTIICSTGTPILSTPSMACLILHELCKSKGAHQAQAYDVNAACSGFLYALQCAYGQLQSRPEAAILVVTTEALSTRVDPEDFSTAILFGDAATATVVYGEARIGRARASLSRPALSGEGDDGSVLSVPLRAVEGEYVHMDGSKVFSVAVRKMVSMLNRACAEAEVDLDELTFIVPHQANERITKAIRNRISLPPEKVFSNIRMLGNTSSSSIPLALFEVLPGCKAGERIGMCAFGGGFTFGAGILTVL